jgi:glycosyltransferase involved in cell wall biosynthesis
MRRLLWIGDACCSTGFARITHGVLDVVRHSWDVCVLGLNAQGEPHDYPYRVWPCYPGGDFWGIGRMRELIYKLEPDLIVIQNDPWNFPRYMEHVGKIPVVAAVAVDGKNCRGRDLNGVKHAIFWTGFGADEAAQGGYRGPASVIPLGVDLETYQPRPRQLAREQLGLSPKLMPAFIVGTVCRNQPRKRLDLTVMYFAEWVKSRSVEDAYLYVHANPIGREDMPTGLSAEAFDVPQLMSYFGLGGRLIWSNPEIMRGDSEEHIVRTYNAFDVQMTQSQNEGWDLPVMEGMACGIPQIVPEWAALGEWAHDAAMLVQCTTFACTPNKVNAIGGIPDRMQTLEWLDSIYESKHGQLWARCRQRGLDLVRQPQFRWSAIGQAYADVFDRVHASFPMEHARPGAGVLQEQ